MTIRERLFLLADEKYKNFCSKLVPTISKDKVIGIKTPILRALAKEIYGSETSREFLSAHPHEYLEENHLHAFLIEQTKDFEECVLSVEKFLPYVDNWATCDSMRPKTFKKNSEKLLPYIEKWTKSNHVYTVRYAIEMLMAFYLDDHFESRFIDMVASVKSDEYYVNMMIAWYFATALAKQWDSAIKVLKDGTLDVWSHNKTIQKAIDSYRITKEQKDYLRTLKR